MSTYEKLDHNRIKLEVHVSAEKFDEGLNKAYIKESKRYNLPGFRKGKAPRQMIEKAYGEGVFYEGAFDAVYVEAYLGALTEAGLEPVDAPDIDIQQIGRGQELIFTATFPVKPEIVLSADMYKGIELEKREYNVTDEQISSAWSVMLTLAVPLRWATASFWITPDPSTASSSMAARPRARPSTSAPASSFPVLRSSLWA